MKLPSPNLTDQTCYASIGFGFDAKNNDLKVVRLVSIFKGFDFEKDQPPAVEVFSLATGQWRMVTASLPPICLLHGCEPQAFVHGALHWLACKRSAGFKIHSFILVFDLEDEVFREIQLPNISSELRYSVAVYGNSFALLQTEHILCGGVQKLWLMEEYGVVSSWVKVLTCAFRLGEGIPRAIGFRRNGKFVFDFNQNQHVSKEFETQEIKDLSFTPCLCTLGDSYVESLVLLDKPANTAVTY